MSTVPAATAPWWLLAPLGEGSVLQDGWFISTLGAVSDGAAVLTLGHETEEPLRVHICLYADMPRGYAHSDLFDLIVMDHGRGSRPVPRDLSPSLTVLETIIRNNEHREVTSEDVKGISHMMTHIERVHTFGSSCLG
jgi:hypothetical protein